MFGDMIGHYEERKEFEVVKLFKAKNDKKPSTFLLGGPPGTGKTSFAREISKSFDAIFMNVELEEIRSSFQALSEKNLKAVFNKAMELAPKQVIIYIDEADALLSERKKEDSSTEASLMSVMLTNMDGFNSGTVDASHITIIVSTNHPANFDKAILQRFDTKLFLQLPKQHEKFLATMKIVNDYDIHTDITEEQFNTIDTKLFSFRENETLTKKALRYGPFYRTMNSNHFQYLDDSIIAGCNCTDGSCNRFDLNYIQAIQLAQEGTITLIHSKLTIQDFKMARRTTNPTTTQKELDDFAQFFGKRANYDIEPRKKQKRRNLFVKFLCWLL